MHRLRIGYVHDPDAKWVIYARKIGYLRRCLISTCDAKWVIYARKIGYLLRCLLSTRDAKCVICARKIKVFMCFLHIFWIVVNFLPFALVDLGPADSSAGFGAGGATGAQPRDSGAAGEGVDLVTFLDVGDFDVRCAHGYGNVANVEARMVFLEDRSGILHWNIFRGISVRHLGAKTAAGREAGGDAVTLICPFWVKHRKGQEEKVFLVPFLYMRPPSSHTSALLCTQDELGQVQKVRGVPLSEIGGVLPGTREVGGADQTAALTARVEAFWLRWEKEVRSDMLRKVEAEARKMAEAQGEDVERQLGLGSVCQGVQHLAAFLDPPRGIWECQAVLGKGDA